MNRLVDTTHDELFDMIIEGLNETEKTFLSGKNKDINTNILNRLIESKYDNPLFSKVKASVIADGLRDDFVKSAIQGQTYKLIYVAGLDRFERYQPVDRAQTGLFYDIEAEEFVEHKVWGRHPGFTETDPFLTGHLYEIEVVPKVVNYTNERTGETNERTFYNLRKYKLLEDKTDYITDVILNSKGLETIIEEASDTIFSESTVTLLSESLLYQTTPLEFEILSVRPVGMTERISSLNDDGSTVYSNKRVMEKNPETGIEEVVQLPFVTNSDTGLSTITFAITGKVELENNRELIYFGTFYPSRMGQYFINSETISEAINDETFLSQDPEKQADYLKYVLVGKKFTGIGNIRRVEAGNDTSQLSINLNMMALIEE